MYLKSYLHTEMCPFFFFFLHLFAYWFFTDLFLYPFIHRFLCRCMSWQTQSSVTFHLHISTNLNLILPKTLTLCGCFCKHCFVLQEMQIWSWELVLIIDITCYLSKWINMYIGLLFNHIWIWAPCVFCSECEICLGLYRSNLMRESAGTVIDGTPRSLKPTQLLFINSCHHSVCSCIQEQHSHMLTLTHYTCIYKHTHTSESWSETTPKPETFPTCYLFSWKSIKLLKSRFVKQVFMVISNIIL